MTMIEKKCCIIGMPVQTGTYVDGCIMGPDAYRTAGLTQVLTELGHSCDDLGNIASVPEDLVSHQNQAIKCLAETVSWARTIEDRSYKAKSSYDLPIFLGGDHSISIGTVPAVTRYAQEQKQEQFVLWLDAHPDFHTLTSTESGNLHGTPVAYFTGRAGFDEYYPPLEFPVREENICMMGIRSVDPAERKALSESSIEVFDMRSIDEHGIANPLKTFLDRVASVEGALHVSLDVDFLDPGIAPAVGTTVPGGATFREAHLIMEMLHDSGLVSSIDLVELNPFLDVKGTTASLMVDLCASLMGRQVLDRKTPVNTNLSLG